MSEKWSELEFIKSVSENNDFENHHLVFGIGDDCAVLNPDHDRHYLVTTDMLVDNVHFNLSWHPPERLGEKCLAVNLSDIAAMGGDPRFVFISICLPGTIEKEWLSKFTSGIRTMLGKYDCILAGGDTVKGDALTVNVTVLGDIEKNKAVMRNNAKAGQSVFVSGDLGSAAAGLELFMHHQDKNFFNDEITAYFKTCHLSPEPEVALGKILAQSGMVTAMQDVSDGIATDLAHICSGSGKKAVINETLLPSHKDLPELALLMGCNKTLLQISGGEDYRLVFTVEQGRDSELITMLNHQGYDRVCRIGWIEEGDGVFLKTKNGDLDISFKGFEHR